jgi:hypothetical protein
MRVQHEHSAHSDKCIDVREFCRQSSPPPTLSSIEMADRSPRNVLRPTSIQSTIYKSTWVWRYKLNVGGEKGNIKAKNLAVGPGNASTSESNSDALAKQVTRTPTAEEIQLRAYEMYVERGRIHGFDTDDWLQAERELSACNT